MSTKWKTGPIDKATWGDGPWQEEPDALAFVDEATGLDCLIVRHPHFGNLNGYVGVPKGHPLFDKDYDDPPVEVHGGLTFAGRSPGWAGSEGKPELFYFGFDTAHAWDFLPGMAAREEAMGMPHFSGEKYRDLAFVKAEVASLAAQLAAVDRAHDLP